MPTDAYQYCPCGRGKKIKFCCGDVSHEVERILRMVEGQQTQAALAQLERELAKHPNRDVFLAMKAEILWRAQEIEAFSKFAEEFEKLAPDNPVALACAAIMHAVRPQDAGEGAMDPQTRSAVQKLQRAFKQSGPVLAPLMFEALGVVSRRLAADQHTLAARAHLLMYTAMASDASHPAYADLMEENRSRRVPLILKQDLDLPEPPENAPWKRDYEAALRLASRGAWQAALEELKELSQHVLGEPILHRAIAMLRCRLGDDEAAAVALRRYAALDGIDPQDGVECEALAQLIDPHSYRTMVDLVETTCEIDDAERVSERLLSERRVVARPGDLSQFVPEGSPPPKGYYWILDRPRVASGVGLDGPDVPVLLGQLLLYGKETDRKARLVFVAHRDQAFDNLLAEVATIAGEELTEGDQVAVGEVAGSMTRLQWDWYLPDDTPVEDRERLIAWRDEEIVMRRWADTPLDVLDGQTPREAATDPKKQLRVQAAILALESTAQGNSTDALDYDQLRQELGLPVPPALTLDPGQIADVALVQLHRVDLSALTDDDLVTAYQRTTLFGAQAALKKVLPELLKRESLSSDQRVNRAIIFAQQSQLASATAEAQSLIHKAQTEAREAGQSPARWLIAELSLLLSRGNVEGVQPLIETLQTKYLREPGIGEMLMQTLAQFGLIRDPAGAGMPAEPAPPAAGEPTHGGEAGGLWTPDQGAPAPAAATGKAAAEEPAPSKLWVPGMD